MGNQHIGVADSAVIVTGGALGEDAGNRGSTVARFAAGMAPHGLGTVLAGRNGSASGTAAVAVVRSDAGLSGAVSTVDDIDSQAGRITVGAGVAASLPVVGIRASTASATGPRSVTVPQ